METAPTWIDGGMVGEWQAGVPARYDRTDRWFVFIHESQAAFVVQSGNAGHGSFGGEDTGYGAAEVASAIERWSTPVAGLETCPEFLESLEHYVVNLKATGTPLEIVRAEYLLAAMRARVAIAKVMDSTPLAGHKHCLSAKHNDGGDGTVTTRVVPWGDGQ